MSNYGCEKKLIFNKGLSYWKATIKNNKVKYSIIKQLKTQTMQTKYDIKRK
jgi:hypothetical protein